MSPSSGVVAAVVIAGAGAVYRLGYRSFRGALPEPQLPVAEPGPAPAPPFVYNKSDVGGTAEVGWSTRPDEFELLVLIVSVAGLVFLVGVLCGACCCRATVSHGSREQRRWTPRIARVEAGLEMDSEVPWGRVVARADRVAPR